jgi:uncharacterized membrane protein (GlpM family)
MRRRKRRSERTRRQAIPTVVHPSNPQENGMKWQGVAPVLVSIVIIVLVAAVQRSSKLMAGLAATMPVNIPLAMWIVGASAENDEAGLRQFTESMLLGIWPTVIYVVVAYVAVRMGWKAFPAIGVGYLAWGVAWILLYGVRRF